MNWEQIEQLIEKHAYIFINEHGKPEIFSGLAVAALDEEFRAQTEALAEALERAERLNLAPCSPEVISLFCKLCHKYVNYDKLMSGKAKLTHGPDCPFAALDAYRKDNQ